MRRVFIWPLSLLVFTILALLGQQAGLLTAGWWVVPWVLSLVLFGLPHGAIDHEVVLRLWQPQPPPRWALGITLVGYLALSLLILIGWFLAPVAIFFGFILLTLAHWGLADLWWSWQRDRDYFCSRWHRGIFALWRGALPMLIPLAADPTFYRQIAEATCHLFLRQRPDFSWMETNETRLMALSLVLFLGLLDFILANPKAKTRWVNAAEGAGLLLFFSLLPALVSVGFYFAFWHGLRHVLRLIETEKMNGKQFALRAIPATLGALLLLGGLFFLTPKYAMGADALLGLYLALIAALTVPHALVVHRMDSSAGLWKI
jgi:beta-carotene 15,15'-dioxygenase